MSETATKPTTNPAVAVNSARQVLVASMVGTTIEFFDFYIYATAAVLVFPGLFFPSSDPTTGRLASLATFGIAFLARPIGSALFGHFGDRIGRKATLVVALSLMGLSTVAIGLLPTYSRIGIAAPILLAACRFGQGLGLGGEWGGAVLLAIENAPPKQRAWYGMFPQLGAPLGFFLSTSVYLLLTQVLTDKQLFAWGWRLPFLASSALVFLGLWVRIAIHETPAFRAMVERGAVERAPVWKVMRSHAKQVLAGILICVATFVLFYLMILFSISWGTTALGYPRKEFLMMQIFAVLFFAAGIPVSALLAERGRKMTMISITAAIFLFGLILAPMFSAGPGGALGMMCLGLLLMGFTYGPLGTMLSELFPTSVRYSGSSLAFNLSGIVGASFAPYIATWLAKTYGLQYVGYYLCLSATLTLIGLLMVHETRDEDVAAR